MTLSDEDLAKVIMAAYHGFSEEGVRQCYWPKLPDGHAQYLRVARAVRAALTPDVAPLKPGERINLADALSTDDRLRLYAERGVLTLDAVNYHDDTSTRALIDLDADGVATLITACRRWQAAQEGA